MGNLRKIGKAHQTSQIRRRTAKYLRITAKTGRQQSIISKDKDTDRSYHDTVQWSQSESNFNEIPFRMH